MVKNIIFSFVFLVTSCTQNLYQGMSNSLSDGALLSQAKQKISISDWDGAIAKFQLMTPSYLATREVAFQYASALAGKCGFNYLDFSTSLGSASVGNTAGTVPFFLWLMQAYMDKEVHILKTGVTAPTAVTDSYCSWAQSILDGVKTNYGSWNTDETNFVVMFSLAKIGIYLRAWADLDGTNSLGDGTIDSTFDACQAASLDDFYVTQIVTGFALVINNFANVVTGGMGNSLTAIQTLCSDPPTGIGLAFCGHTTPATVTATDRLNIRGMLMMDDQNLVLGGLGLNEFTSAATLAATTPGTGAWRCNLLGGTPPPTEYLLNCCP